MKKKICSHRIHSYFVRNFVRFFVRNLIHIHPYTFVFVHIHSYICHPKSYIKHICNLVMSSFRLQWNFFTIYDRTIFAICHDWCNCTHAWMFISRLDLVACNAATSKPSKARGFVGSIMKILKSEVTYIQYVKRGGGGWEILIRTKNVSRCIALPAIFKLN